MQLRYFTPFAFLALLPLGEWLGGAWAFLATAATITSIAGLDGALGESTQSSPSMGTIPRWLPRIYIVLQLAATACVAARVADPRTGFIEVAGLSFSAGLTTGIFGFVAAHEMIHSRDPRDRALGLTLLATVFYMQFRIAHVHGHHRRAATPDDPATARLGEGLYAFVVRSVTGQFREAWKFEQRRRQRSNRMHRYLLIEFVLAVAAALLSLRALAFLIAVAAIAIFVLEGFNYVAHYGLTRGIGGDGRVERLGPHHSWNSTRRMNNAALLNMGRHSDHHIHMSNPYQTLVELEEEAQLPSGYASALLTALVPPLWRRTMDPRVRAIAEGR